MYYTIWGNEILIEMHNIKLLIEIEKQQRIRLLRGFNAGLFLGWDQYLPGGFSVSEGFGGAARQILLP